MGEMERTREQIEYRKNGKTNFTLLAKRTKMNRKLNEEMGGKCETITGHMV
jgi:hypothetical protein